MQCDESEFMYLVYNRQCGGDVSGCHPTIHYSLPFWKARGTTLKRCVICTGGKGQDDIDP